MDVRTHNNCKYRLRSSSSKPCDKCIDLSAWEKHPESKKGRHIKKPSDDA